MTRGNCELFYEQLFIQSEEWKFTAPATAYKVMNMQNKTGPPWSVVPAFGGENCA